MKFTSLYKHDRNRSAMFATVNRDPSMTQQTDTNDTDINVIVGRFMKTGQLPTVTAQAITGDFSDGREFRDMMNQLNVAKDAFMALPANIRGRFDNDPALFIDWANNKDNLDELRKLGLANPLPDPPKEPDPIKVIVTNQEAPK